MKLHIQNKFGATVHPGEIKPTDELSVYLKDDLTKVIEVDTRVATIIQSQRLIADMRRTIAEGAAVKDASGTVRVLPMSVNDAGLIMGAMHAWHYVKQAPRFKWRSETMVKKGTVMERGEGRTYVAINAGRTGEREPTFPAALDYNTPVTDGEVMWSLFVQVLATTTGMAYFGRDEVESAAAEIMLFTTRSSAALHGLLDRLQIVSATPGAKPQDVFDVAWAGSAPLRTEQFAKPQ